MDVKIKHMLYKKLNFCHANVIIINDMQNYFYGRKICGNGLMIIKKII